MDVQDADVIRRKVDALRQTMRQGAAERQDPPIAVISKALSDIADSEQSSQARDIQRVGSIHMCPWHTCAATRHGIVD
jgi:hypothetical protein